MSNLAFDEFLYMDPDTGMVVFMIADGDGFRPAHAADEMQFAEVGLTQRTTTKTANATTNEQALDASTSLSREADFDALDEFNNTNMFVDSYEHSYGSQSSSMT